MQLAWKSFRNFHENWISDFFLLLCAWGLKENLHFSILMPHRIRRLIMLIQNAHKLPYSLGGGERVRGRREFSVCLYRLPSIMYNQAITNSFNESERLHQNKKKTHPSHKYCFNKTSAILVNVQIVFFFWLNELI